MFHMPSVTSVTAGCPFCFVEARLRGRGRYFAVSLRFPTGLLGGISL